MGWSKTLIEVMPFVVEMMRLAEKAYHDKPKSGEEKKALVMEATKSVTEGMTELSTGGQKHTWEVISEPISKFVDAACGFLFGSKKKEEVKGKKDKYNPFDVTILD